MYDKYAHLVPWIIVGALSLGLVGLIFTGLLVVVGVVN